MAEVNWTAEALDQVYAIRAYIRKFDPVAAERVALRLFNAANSLAYFPNRGRPGPRGTRELAIVPPYVIRYRITGDVVSITTVKHGRQR